MKEKSYLFFASRDVERRLNDHVFQIRALDPYFRIRENVHTGNVEKTGYGIQVFIDNEQQNTKLIKYLKLRNIKDCLVIVDDYAWVLNLKTMKCRAHYPVYYYDNIFQKDKHLGYSIHIEDSRFIGYISFMIVESVKNLHPELNQIDDGSFITYI